MTDTSLSAEQILIQGYRIMPAWKKLRQVSSLKMELTDPVKARKKLGRKLLTHRNAGFDYDSLFFRLH